MKEKQELTDREVAKEIRSDDAYIWIASDGYAYANWTYKRITGNQLMRLQDKGIIVYDHKDDIFITV